MPVGSYAPVYVVADPRADSSRPERTADIDVVAWSQFERSQPANLNRSGFTASKDQGVGPGPFFKFDHSPYQCCSVPR